MFAVKICNAGFNLTEDAVLWYSICEKM